MNILIFNEICLLQCFSEIFLNNSYALKVSLPCIPAMCMRKNLILYKQDSDVQLWSTFVFRFPVNIRCSAEMHPSWFHLPGVFS